MPEGAWGRIPHRVYGVGRHGRHFDVGRLPLRGLAVGPHGQSLARLARTQLVLRHDPHPVQGSGQKVVHGGAEVGTRGYLSPFL